MILVFGGTTEGKEVTSFLEDQNIAYTYTTKTKISFKGKGNYINGAMEPEDIVSFCEQHKVTHIINAAHPFAENLHNNIIKAEIKLPKIRFERTFLEQTKHPLVNYVHSFEEAVLAFKKNNYQTLLALSGVQTIKKLKPFWLKHTTWFRILDRDESRAVAFKASFPENNLLYGFPQEKIEEVKLFKQYSPDVIITKESGINGKLQQKIEAAIITKTPIYIISKPTVSKIYICLKNINELVKYL